MRNVYDRVETIKDAALDAYEILLDEKKLNAASISDFFFICDVIVDSSALAIQSLSKGESISVDKKFWIIDGLATVIVKGKNLITGAHDVVINNNTRMLHLLTENCYDIKDFCVNILESRD
jgi:hypothetical protein